MTTFYISKRDLEMIGPKVDKMITNVLGYQDSSLLTCTLACLSAGSDAKKLSEKFSVVLDAQEREMLAKRIMELVHSRCKPCDVKRQSENGDDAVKRVKMEPSLLPPPLPLVDMKPVIGTPLTDVQIKVMMANAQRMIEEKKRAMQAFKMTEVISGKGAEADATHFEKQNKIAQLQAQIQSKISSGLLKTFAPPKAAETPAPLILDSEGRTVDMTGQEVQLPHVVPTLKANIRARKREVFQKFQDKPTNAMDDSLSMETNFFDPRIAVKNATRGKKALKFHEPGKFQQMADRMRMKSKLEKLQNEISQIARKTGISSAAKLAQLAPKEENTVEVVPDVEWWDSIIIDGESYENLNEGSDNVGVKLDAITNLVEHPTQMRPPTESTEPIFLPVFLTKAEQKKLRRQNRRETWKEEQEKIRLGLTAPPEPKLRISNLMRVLGTEAVQDPTKMEAHVRAQMAKRQKAHENMNASRKLTKEQRREKCVRKISEDTSAGVHVAVYRVTDLSNQAKKYKVETNAKQLLMTGIVIMFHNCNVVVVEGGPKQQRKYKRLMLNRIKWGEDMVKNNKDKTDIPNSCTLIWEGMTKQRRFSEMRFKACITEKLAREQMKRHQMEQYWDLAYSKTVLEAPDDK